MIVLLYKKIELSEWSHIWQLKFNAEQVVKVITGSIARSANLPVFSLLRGRF